MKSFRGINFSVSDEEKIFLSRLGDKMLLSEKRFSPQFTDFADERQLMLAQRFFAGEGFERYAFYGGYEGAERKIVCVYPEFFEPLHEDFPIMTVKYSFRVQDKITHPQILGKLMSLGIKRELVGDIIVSEGEAYAFFCKKGAEIASCAEKIGRIGVKAEIVRAENLKRHEEFSEKNVSVSSMRLDCVAAAAVNMSREKIQALIKSEGISVNHIPVFSPDHIIKNGDIFSVRGKGKFILSENGEKSRRGKNFITLKKYKN